MIQMRVVAYDPLRIVDILVVLVDLSATLELST